MLCYAAVNGIDACAVVRQTLRSQLIEIMSFMKDDVFSTSWDVIQTAKRFIGAYLLNNCSV